MKKKLVFSRLIEKSFGVDATPPAPPIKTPATSVKAPSGTPRAGLQGQQVVRKDGKRQTYWKRNEAPAPAQKPEANNAPPASIPVARSKYAEDGDTQSTHTTVNEQGKREYTPERRALHEKIISHYMDGGDHPERKKLIDDHQRENHQPHAVYTLGGPGSGKGYISDKHYTPHSSFVHIDSDAIKAHLAAADGKPGHNNTHASHYHGESRDIADELHHRAIKHKKSFLYDSTGTNPDMVDKVNAAKAGGHKTIAHFVKVHPDTAVKRDAQRDRTIGEKTVRAIHAGVDEAYKRLKPHVDKMKVIDNNDDPKDVPLHVRLEAMRKQKAEKSIARSTNLILKSYHADAELRVRCGLPITKRQRERLNNNGRK